ncbi:MAG: trypsin-like peptidase domain-containing protein [Gemmobacter sp.]
MPLDYARRPPYARPFRDVEPIIDATGTIRAVGQIIQFMLRRAQFSVGVPDTSFFPFSAICHLGLTFPSGFYTGTGFYIRDDLILTCGHNLFDQTPDGSGTESCTQVVVSVGQQDASTRLARFTVNASDFDAHYTWVASGATNRGFDLGILRVTTPPPNGEFFHLINHSPAADTPIAVCGYGGEEVDSDKQHLDIDRVRAITPDIENFDYNLQTRRGNSGSPVFAYFTDAGGEMPETIPVMGVHVASESSQLNRGVLLTPDKIDWAMGGGNTSVSTFSLRRGRAMSALGGLPLVQRTDGRLGGLPLLRAGAAPVAQAQGWARPMARHWIVIDETARGGMSVARRTFGHPTHDLSGVTDLSVRVANMPSGGSVVWNVPHADHQPRVIFEDGSSTSHTLRGVTTARLRCTAAGPVAIDVMVKDAGGTTVESNKYWLSSPQFVLVAIHATTDAFFDAMGMTAQRAAIYTEMRATLRHLYRNVNVRFVFPGEALPLHLGLASDPDFPGGVQVLPAVQYAEVIGSDSVLNPETGAAYRTTQHGQAHLRTTMPGRMQDHVLARGLVHHFANTRPEIAHVQAEATGGRLTAGDLALAATMFGRLIGENLAHEVGHHLAGFTEDHQGTTLLEEGRLRSNQERTGMTIQTTAPLLTDHGRGTVNELPANVLRTFEAFLPVNPPIDQAGVDVRPGVGSFALGARPRGWVNRPAGRSLSEARVHLPGTTVLSGWQSSAFVFALDAAFRTVMAANPATAFFAPFLSVDRILDICDRFGVTLAVGTSITGGLMEGGSAGVGIVFGPGQNIGFYGTKASVLGWIASAGISAQLTFIKGPPSLMDGAGWMAGVSISTLGWFTEDLVDAPIGAHAVFGGDGTHIGYALEFGLSVGVPILSLIEVFGQRTETAMTFGSGHRTRALSAGTTDGLAAAVEHAMAEGATRAEAEAFLSPFFPQAGQADRASERAYHGPGKARARR